MFTDKHLDSFQGIRPDLTDEQIDEIMCFLSDQKDQGTCFENADMNEVFKTAAQYMFPNKGDN